MHKQNAENPENGVSDDIEKVEQSERRDNLNPFATDEDDDDDDVRDDNEEFTIGDLEVEEEGKGHLSPASSLTGKKITLRALNNVSF